MSDYSLNLSKEHLAFAATMLSLAWAIFSWTYQNRSVALRDKIKSDLEILEKLKVAFGEGHETTKQAEQYVLGLLAQQYANDSSRPAVFISWPDLALGIFLLVVAGVWASLGEMQSWHTYVAIIMVFVAFGAFLNAFDRNARQWRNA
ncbi:hypothetical protein GCM10009092_21440 [Bowmanella denitrificans]|uniref:Uncharacterized protein n=1 Tax=Bowmanella denitrificans TaxID=366582 RepID=A0ABN0X796_9ALTE|nr:hypothetical protein [Bowmanella denitrificans]